MRQIVKVLMDYEKGIGTGGAIVVVFVLGLLFVSAFIDVATCPRCGGAGVTIENTQICSTCGGDGKITVLNYIYCWIRDWVSEGVENDGG